ncbi:MAG: hypothetical protein M3R55_12795 [Acidobacteriota bacterium]|nr:hypothetical protein [Acidobacteriota bacterium]MDQ3169791.1 hypothetical protein [Acidobacteriota bacterium]
MRFRTSAALALVMALLASPASALACGFECRPASADITAVPPVETELTEGSCHREAAKSADGEFALSATMHDCSTHGATVPGLRAAQAASNSAREAATSVPAARYALGAASTSARPPVSPHDLAPPRLIPAQFAPLRL